MLNAPVDQCMPSDYGGRCRLGRAKVLHCQWTSMYKRLYSGLQNWSRGNAATERGGWQCRPVVAKA
jgi:hypothetical protein